MARRSPSRRQFLQTSSAVAAGVTMPYFLTRTVRAQEQKNDKLRFALIACGGQGRGDAARCKRAGAELVAVCDVDKANAEKANNELCGGQGQMFEDYRKVLDMKDLDFVVVAPPDHWHTKISIEAMKAGLDVYCEKPLTLTIDEGKMICKVVKDTKKVFQVGTQQRSEDRLMFLNAVALAQSGRLGKIQTVECRVGGGDKGGPFKKSTPPEGLNWDMWLGQAPMVDYIKERCHYQFRWWYEYSGGKMTDWGAHHVDIAQWAIGMQNSGPTEISGTAKHQMPFEKGYPTRDDMYNTAIEFKVSCKFANGVEMIITDGNEYRGKGDENGVMITGETGRIFVNRGKLTGKAVEELKENPLPEGTLEKLYNGKKPEGFHAKNFLDCIRDRGLPVSDVFTHHRAMTTCHLANLAIRLDRKLKWNPDSEMIEGDDEAKAFQSRTPRKGYEIDA
jgi:predicted dehydrogenase